MIGPATRHAPVAKPLRQALTLVLIALAALVTGCRETPAASSDIEAERLPGVYVQAGAQGGDGSEAQPFGSLAMASEATAEGDVVYLLPSDADLDGGIELAPSQKLLGIGDDGQISSEGIRLTNTTDHLGGIVVQLSANNEVAGVHLVDLRSHGIRGNGAGLSGTHIHHVRVSGATESEELLWSVYLETATGSIDDVVIADSVFQNGNDLAGILIEHRGDSSGRYRFERNEFSDLGGRAYQLWSQGTSKIETEILDSEVDNIGLEDRNSDSILPRLWDSSEQSVTVRNFVYNNTLQVGNRSNCGTEAFIMGAPFPNPEHHCDGCKLTLEISDSIYNDPVTDGIQLINFGTNSVLDVRIRNTVVRGAKPQQVGGGISLLPQNAENSGSRSTLLVENTDVLGSSQYAVAISDAGEGYTSVVDLGGGELGSEGNNRFLGSTLGEVRVIQANPVARNNWWGGEPPRIELEGEASGVDWQPALEVDPGPR